VKRWLWWLIGGIGVVVVVVVVVALLGGGGGASGMSVSDAWSRSTASSQTTAALYATISNNDGTKNALVGVKVPSSVAMSTQLHHDMTMPTTTMGGSSTTMGGSSMGGSSTTMAPSSSSADTDMTTMQEVTSIPVSGDATFKLQPGGYHVMLMDLAKPLTKGEHFDVTFQFEHGPSKTVSVTVK
jgi:copper(I)-binding protein